MIERWRLGRAHHHRRMVGVVTMEEVQRPAVVDLAKSQHVDQERIALVELRRIEIHMCDLARPVGDIGRVLMVVAAADHRQVAAFDVGKAEAIAAARGGDLMRRLGGAAARGHLLVQRVHDVAVGGVERQPPHGGRALGGMDRQDVMVSASAAKPDRAVLARDLRQIPDLRIELSRALRLAHFDVDTTNATHCDFHDFSGPAKCRNSLADRRGPVEPGRTVRLRQKSGGERAADLRTSPHEAGKAHHADARGLCRGGERPCEPHT